MRHQQSKTCHPRRNRRTRNGQHPESSERGYPAGSSGADEEIRDAVRWEICQVSYKPTFARGTVCS